MKITELFTKEEHAEMALKGEEITGTMKSALKKSMFSRLVFLICGIFLIVLETITMLGNSSAEDKELFFVLGVYFSVIGLYGLIFGKKIYYKRMKKNLLARYAFVESKYNVSLDNAESITEINGDYVDTIDMGMTVRYMRKDFVKTIDDDKYYIMEFAMGRYLFFKKTSFDSRESFLQFVEEVKIK